MHIYVLTNKVNGKRYVGQTIRSLERRLYEHGRASSKKIISRAILKHGWDKFTVTSCELQSLSELNEFEEFLVRELDTHISRNGYNAKKGGANHKGQPITKAARAKISAALVGRPMSEKCRQALIESNKNRFRSRESIEKQASKIRGRKLSRAMRQKISDGLKGRVLSAETRAKISEANAGKKRTPEQIEAMRQGLIGKKASPETRAKMSASHRARLAAQKET